MAHFLLLVFVFAGQLTVGFSTQKLPPPDSGDTISILSIDGGGIKGIIPARVLDHLDKALKARDPTATLAHYFDVIAGTSTGGLIAAMLASPSPDDPDRPGFTPAEIVQFYKEYGPCIFNESRPGIWAKFDGKCLHNITRELLKETRLNETLTNVVIPTFDLLKQKPVIFSNFKLNTVPYLNAKMSDICIATSAAPTLLPPHYFQNDGVDFITIDGAVAASNPTQAAISEVIQHNKYTKILLLSLGTGVTKLEFDIIDAFTWNESQWKNFAEELLSHASSNMTEYYLATGFSGLHQPMKNYLRIQEYSLDPSLDNGINVTKENLDNLDEAGKNCCKKMFEDKCEHF
ncbi:Patatin group A-3 [Spatholobus suberectus]|nr:Patatin group A-3 [Spatholobus suberectus]